MEAGTAIDASARLSRLTARVTEITAPMAEMGEHDQKLSDLVQEQTYGYWSGKAGAALPAATSTA